MMRRGPLFRDRRGATIVEFAIVAPVMMLMIMGLGDILYQVYVQSVLTGAVQKAGRDSGIEGGASTTSAIDAKVQTAVSKVVTISSIASTRKSYDSFSNVAPEPFTDSNSNGIRDAGECFTDENANGTWDADPGATGQGGASAVVLYTVSISYKRVFPITGFLGGSSTQTVSATTLLKNQPYAAQSTTTASTVCT